MGVWNWIVQNGDGLAGVAAVVAALIAVWGVYATAKDSRDRTRPIVAAKLVRELEADTTANLLISNTGHSVARNVKVVFDPPVPDPNKTDQHGFAERIRKRYEKPIELITPGEVRQNIWQTYSVGQPTLGTPDTTTVTISYKGPRGRQRYTDRYLVSIEDLNLETYITESDNTVKGRLKAIAKNTDKIAGQLGKLAAAQTRRP